MRIWYLVDVFMLLNWFDAVATLYAIRHGYAYEGNPVCRWTMTHGVFLPFKAGIGCLALLFGLGYERGMKQMAMWCLGLAVGAYGLLAVWHVALYFLTH